MTTEQVKNAINSALEAIGKSDLTVDKLSEPAPLNFRLDTEIEFMDFIMHLQEGAGVEIPDSDFTKLGEGTVHTLIGYIKERLE